MEMDTNAPTDYCSNITLPSSCSALNTSSLSLEEENCTSLLQRADILCNCTNHGIIEFSPDLGKGFTIIGVMLLSLVGNICTIIMVSKFKVRKIPDVLVIGLAVTDLFATVVPIPMSMYAYFEGVRFTEGCMLCNFFGTMAHFTRYSSALIVTLVSLERYFAVNKPFIYRKYATPYRFVIILLVCWLIAFLLAAAPLVTSTTIVSHDGYCLFELSSYYGIAILGYAAIQYVTVFFCFVLVTVELIKVYRRRSKLKVQGNYNNSSRARSRSNEVTFTKPNLTSRISDFGKSIKKAAPIIQEKFQLSVEAQFARMFFIVVALFYISWSTIVILIFIAQINRSADGLESALFWGIRISIISTALNPFIYGILARQYRLAYFYIIRLCVSKCCYCVAPPLKDVFAAARGGDAKSRQEQASRHGVRHSLGTHGDSYYSKQFSESNMIPQSITLPPNLRIIHEDFSLDDKESSITADYIASTGELSSANTDQVREGSSTCAHQQMREAVSVEDLVDSGLVELGDSKDAKLGINNPLAVMTRMINGEETIVSPVGSDMDSEDTNNLSPDPFSNPVYSITNGSSSTLRTQDQVEAEILKRQNMLAASSTDDITLLSKKKKRVTKTLSHDIPYQSSPVTMPPWLRETEERVKTGVSIRATDIDTGREMMVSSQEILSGGERKSIPLRARGINSVNDMVKSEADFIHRPQRNSISLIREHFEAPPDVRIGQSHSHTRTRRQNSLENSDSGRESMVLEPDTVVVNT